MNATPLDRFARHSWKPDDFLLMLRFYPSTENEALGKMMDPPRTWSAVQNMANKLGLKKSPEFMRTIRFHKGHTPWNAGMYGWQPGGRAKATQFRKGNKPQTWRPVGSERVNPDGTLERKVRNPDRWKPVKDIIWEAKHGRIPRGMFVVHKNRNRQDFRLRNLELVDRAENMRRNTYHRYPKEISRLIQLRGALNRQINKRLRNEKQAV